MPSLATTLLALATSATAVLGHGHVRRVIANGVSYPGFEFWATGDESQTVTWHFTTQDEGPVPISSINGPDIVCHLGATNAQRSIPVAAGSQLKVVRFNTRGGYEHPGPELHYLASCGDAGCAKIDKKNLKFFKIYEKGLVKGGMADSPQKWASTEIHKRVQPEGEGFIDTYTVNIPANIKPGQYVLRHELIALHRAQIGDTEFYPQCINLEITGSGTQQPEGVAATELYHSNDPGVALNIWVDLQSYKIPGPAVASGLSKRGATTSKRHPRDLEA
ncbi:lytic polysaccharide monooxygenase [Hypomontagnella monticulosa]|nr:lytic polysaccharide monooxygenase [Hypomontagnella monticulosa]